MKIKITRDCCCEHDLHEMAYYPRSGQTLQKFKEGDILEYLSDFDNFYGSYYRCKTKKGTADISKVNAVLIDESV